jgi:hypothetical protein
MPLSRLANPSPNGRSGLGLVVIWGSCRNMRHQSHSSSIRGQALSPPNFTVCLMKTSTPCRTWAGLPPFGPPTPNSSQSQPSWRTTPITSVPRGLDAPWFLRDDDNDDASTGTSHHTTPNEADPEDPNYFAPTNHLYDDPPAAPAAPDPL